MSTDFKARQEDMHLCAERVRQELGAFAQLAEGRMPTGSLLQGLTERLSRQPLRAYFVCKVYECVKASLHVGQQLRADALQLDALFQRKVAFAFEVAIHIQYLHNHILDGKCGVDNPRRIHQTLLEANRLKDLLYDYVDTHVPERHRRPVAKCLRHVFAEVDMGQQVEKDWNTYDALLTPEQHDEWHGQLFADRDALSAFPGMAELRSHLHHDLPYGLRDFADLYLCRIYKTCAALFVAATELVLDLTGYDRPDRSRFLHFAGSYGLMRQLVNDNADYTPSHHGLATKDKVAADAFSDLRNRNVTLPLLLHLTHSQGTQGALHAYLAEGVGRCPTQEEEALMADELMASHALYKSVQYGKLMAAVALSHLPMGTHAAAMLADTCQIAHWNKFLVPVLKKPACRRYRQSAHYGLMKRRQEAAAAAPAADHIVVATPTPVLQRWFGRRHAWASI